MNVYDWDKTIVPYDSTVKFYFYCLLRNPKMLKKLPYQIKGWFLYFTKRIDKTTMKSYFYSFLPEVKNIDLLIENFWDKNIKKVNKWYKDRQKEDDIVISASPYFLIKPACERLNIKTLLASGVDKYSGEITSPNCSSQEKVNAFVAYGGNINEIEQFYSDSYNDRYMAKLAKKAYLVKGSKLKQWDKF